MSTVTQLIEEGHPSLQSELSQFRPTLVDNEEIRNGVTLGSRFYSGGTYRTNLAFGVVNGKMGYLGRMSLPSPIRYNGDSAPPMTVAASDLPADGDADSEATPKRYYRFSWADENTTSGALLKGLGADKPATDARSTTHVSPFGGFGQLCEGLVEVELTGTSKAVEITGFGWTVPGDRCVTHAYVWCALEVEGPWYFVGRVERANLGSPGLFDTLSVEQLQNRTPHVQDWLCVPTFSSMCRTAGRIIGIAGGSNMEFATLHYDPDLAPYANVENDSTTVVLVDKDGFDPGQTWPGFLENGGARISLAGKRYLIDQIDVNDRSILYLALPYEGADDDSLGFHAYGANSLYICANNEQQQEQCRAAWELTEQDFQAQLQAVCAAPSENGAFVFAQGATWLVHQLGGPDAIDAPRPWNGQVTKVSSHYGCVGPRACCEGPNKSVFALSAAALIEVNATGARPISNDVLQSYLRPLDFRSKAFARLEYDPVRSLLYVLLPQPPDERRVVKGYEGLDKREVLIVLDLDSQAYSVWSGAWADIAVMPSIAEGASGQAAGSVVCLQDRVGDLLRLDENLLSDKVTPKSVVQDEGIPYATVTTITGVSLSPGTVEIQTQHRVSPRTRGADVMILNGQRRGKTSRVLGIRVSGFGWVTEYWDGFTPQVGDRIMVGAILAEWQSGVMARPEGMEQSTIRALRITQTGEVDDVLWDARLVAWSGGTRSKVEDRYSPDASRFANHAVIAKGDAIGMPRVKPARRTVVGLEYIQPLATENILWAHDYERRIRIEELEVDNA